MNETQQPAVAGPVEPTVRPVAWRVRRSDGKYELYFEHAAAVRAAQCYVPTSRAEPLYSDELKRERDMLMETLRDEMDENLRLRELGGAWPDENITAMTERLIRELEAHRLYARALCKAVDAATDFAGTVAGGASWWDDVWADHAAALDRARERITLAGGPNTKLKDGHD
jgi:hypothetical protein